MPIKLLGSTAGYIVLDAPAIAGNNVVSLPSGNGTSFVLADANGRVGIGTNTPRGVLDLNTTRSPKIYFGASSIGETQSGAAAYLANDLYISNDVAGTLTYTKMSTDNGTAILADYSRGVTFYTGVTGADGTTGTLNSFERMRITSGGLVGIGTITPSYPLEVRSSMRVQSNDLVTASNNAGIIIINTANGNSSIRNTMIVFDPNGANAVGVDYSILGMYGSGEFEIANYLDTGFITLKTGNAGTERMRITPDGSIGFGLTPSSAYSIQAGTNYASGFKGFSIGYLCGGASGSGYPNIGYNIRFTSTADVYQYHSSDTASMVGFKSGKVETFTASSGTGGNQISFTTGPYVAVGGTTWTNGSSDVRQKKNFEPTQGLAELLQIEPVKYHFNWENDTAPKRLGFKAQNLKPLIPEMVVEKDDLAEDGTPLLTITPDYILPVLVKAIQELTARIETLESK